MMNVCYEKLRETKKQTTWKINLTRWNKINKKKTKNKKNKNKNEKIYAHTQMTRPDLFCFGWRPYRISALYISRQWRSNRPPPSYAISIKVAWLFLFGIIVAGSRKKFPCVRELYTDIEAMRYTRQAEKRNVARNYKKPIPPWIQLIQNLTPPNKRVVYVHCEDKTKMPG